MNRIVREATGYAGVSAVALAVDFVLLGLQVSVLGLPYLLAAAISFSVGTVIVYLASIRHIFRHRSLADWRHEFAVFAAIGLAGLAVNLVAMYTLVTGFGLHYMIAKVGAAGFTFTTNFVLRRWLLFTPKARRAAPGGDEAS